MSGSVPVHWLDRVSEALREHEDRRSSIQSTPPRYEILGEISRGGMGIVYRAWDPQLGRNVALKVLHPEDGRAAEAHERFQREAKLAAGLHHPHIVQVFDTGTWQGQDYIAMQLIEGTTLEQAKPDRKQALTCIRDAARGLHYAHTQGIVHRDVKPGNLLLDGSGRVFVSDFGVARQAVVSATITSPGTVVGTPAYMSPEQALGMPTDARSDVYSLGATLYDLVTGRAPVQGRDAMEVLESVRLKDPELPTRAAPDLSKNVESIILGAMERCPEDRYATAEELAADIDRYLAGERPLRRPRGVSYRVRREFVRHPWRSAAAIVLCVLLLGAGVFLGYFIRGWVHLQRAERSSNEDEQIREYKIAGAVFPSARERYEQLKDAKAKRLKTAEEAEAARRANLRDAELARQAEEERKNRERELKQVQAELDVTKREQLILQTGESALRHIESGQFDEARLEIDALRGPAPTKHDELLLKLRKKRFEVGIVELRRLSPSETSPEFDSLFGELSGKDYQDRRELLADPAWLRALALERLGKTRDAVDWFTKAENLGKKDAVLNEHRGICLLALKEWQRAEKDRNELLGRRPGQPLPAPFAELPYRKGAQYVDEKNWDAAIIQFAIANGIDQKHAMTYHDQGIARYRSLDLAREALVEDLEKALLNKPDLKPAPVYREIALAFARREAEAHWKDDQAENRTSAWNLGIVWLTRILEKTSPDDPDLLMERSRMRRRLGDYPQALIDANRADTLRSDLESRLAKGTLTLLQAKEESRIREAIALFDQAAQLAPADSRILYWRGLARQRLGKGGLEPALSDFRAALGANTPQPHLSLQMARARMELLGESKNAEGWADVARVAERAASQAEHLTEEEFAGASLEFSNLSRAGVALKIAGAAHLTRAQALYEREEYETAIQECSAALEADPKDASSFLWRGYARYWAKHYKEAELDLLQAQKLFTDPEEIKNAQDWLKKVQKKARD